MLEQSFKLRYSNMGYCHFSIYLKYLPCLKILWRDNKEIKIRKKADVCRWITQFKINKCFKNVSTIYRSVISEVTVEEIHSWLAVIKWMYEQILVQMKFSLHIVRLKFMQSGNLTEGWIEQDLVSRKYRLKSQTEMWVNYVK